MKTLSYWASRNIFHARVLIVVIKILLLFLAVYTATLTSNLPFPLPYSGIAWSCLSLTLAAIYWYPKKWKRRHQYLFQKICDFTLPFCSFIIIVASLSNIENHKQVPTAFASTTMKPPTAAEILASGKKRADLTRQEKRILRHEFTRQLKNYAFAKLNNDQEKANNSWKIVLAIVAFVGLTLLLAGLVCELSCNGSDGAATIVGVLGLAGLIWGLIALIRHIKRKNPKAKDG